MYSGNPITSFKQLRLALVEIWRCNDGKGGNVLGTLLTVAGTVIGTAVGGPVGGAIGAAVGSTTGGLISGQGITKSLESGAISGATAGVTSGISSALSGASAAATPIPDEDAAAAALTGQTPQDVATGGQSLGGGPLLSTVSQGVTPASSSVSSNLSSLLPSAGTVQAASALGGLALTAADASKGTPALPAAVTPPPAATYNQAESRVDDEENAASAKGALANLLQPVSSQQTSGTSLRQLLGQS